MTITQDNQHPEIKPNVGDVALDQFTFDIKANTDQNSFACKELELQVSALDMRIDRLDQNLTLNNTRVIRQILNVGRDPDELRALATGLERVANIIGLLDESKEKQTVLKLAQTNPSFFAWAFANLEPEVDKAIELFQEDMDLNDRSIDCSSEG